MWCAAAHTLPYGLECYQRLVFGYALHPKRDVGKKEENLPPFLRLVCDYLHELQGL